MATPNLVLAIDIGSTWCKAAYINRQGEIVAGGRAYVRGGPPFGHSDVDLASAWSSVVSSVRQATRHLTKDDAGKDPAALSISARKAPGIWLDEHWRAIDIPSDSIRSASRDDIDACYEADVWGADDPFAYGYSIDLLGNTRWLRRSFPDLWKRVRHAGTLHNWLLWKLTGQWVTSPAAGPVQHAWPSAAEELTGLPLEAFPEVVSEAAPVGPIRDDVADELGISALTPVVAGTHDGAAANIGAGAIVPGDACITLGTNGVLRVVTGRRMPRRFGYTITDGRWALVRDVPGLSLRLDRIVHAIDGTRGSVLPKRHEELEVHASTAEPGGGGLTAALLDTSVDDTKALIKEYVDGGLSAGIVYRAALEDAAFRLLGLQRHALASGASIERLTVTGGAKRNEVLLDLLASVLQREIMLPHSEAGLIGVGILASIGKGWFDSVDSAAAEMVRYQDTVKPDSELVDIYAAMARGLDIPTGIAPGDGFSAPEHN